MEDRKIKEWIDLLSKLPPIKKSEIYDNNVHCQACRTIYNKHKLIKLEDISIFHTGVISATDKICKECQKLVSDLCPVVCVVCKDVVSRIAPGKDKHGFEVKKNKAYHIEYCPVCNPDIFEKNPNHELRLIEKIIYDVKIRNLKQ